MVSEINSIMQNMIPLSIYIHENSHTASMTFVWNATLEILYTVEIARCFLNLPDQHLIVCNR